MKGSTIFAAGLLFGGVFLAAVFAPDWAPQAMAAKTDAEIAFDKGELSKEEARSVNELRRTGIHVTLAELKSAEGGAPTNGAEAVYAEIATPAYEAVNPRDADHAPHKALCYVTEGHDGVQQQIVYYNADHFYTMNGLPVSQWIRSGCAEAIRSHGVTTTKVNYLLKVRPLIPATDINRNERDMLSGAAHFICGDAAKKAGGTDLDRMRNADRCRARFKI